MMDRYSPYWMTSLVLAFSLVALAAAQSESPSPAAADTTKLISMRFKEASLEHVLEFFSNATGTTIIKESELQGRVTVMSPAAIPVDEALTVLNSILAIKGYTGILNGKALKVIPLSQAKQDAIPIREGSDPELISADDTVVTQVMQLSFADATQLAKDLQELMPEYGVMTAHARTNALIITASSAAIRRLAQIAQYLDFSVSGLMKVEVFQLGYADAEEIARLITELFETSGSSSSDQRNQDRRRQIAFGGRGGPGGRGGGQPPQATEASASGESMLEQLGEVKAVADENMNAVVVSASEPNLVIIRGLVAELDQQMVDQPATRVFGLSYADATEVASELNQAFSSSVRNTFDTGQSSGRGGPGRSFGRGQDQARQSQNTATGEGVLGLPELVAVPDTRTNSVIVTTTEQQMEAVGNLIEQLDQDIADFAEDTRVFMLEYAEASNIASVLNDLLSTQLFEQGNARATGRGRSIGFGGFTSQGGSMGSASNSAEDARGLTGNVKIVADDTTNALLITTFVRNFPVIERIIKELDILLPQVLIEAQIVEVTLDDETMYGVEWMWEQQGLTFRDTEYDGDATTSFGSSEEIFGLKYGLISDNLDVMLHALAKDTQVNILSTPRIMTQNNEEAVINIGQEIPYLQSTQETAAGGVLTSYSFQDVGVILTVTPRINRSGSVSLDVDQQINSLIEFTLFNAPVISKREASAYVTVQDGQTMIIGGIIKDDKTQTVHKVPILGDIPFLGKLFQRADTNVEKTELMVFITPHVVFTDEDANRVTEEQKAMMSLHKRAKPNQAAATSHRTQ